MSAESPPTEAAPSGFRKLGYVSLAFVVGVIVWGAVVRATGSGAGCGSHWPTCNGEVLPRDIGDKTLIELTHRVTSGLSALLVWAQWWWARRLVPAGHRLRRATGWACIFMIGEVAIGAGIVLLHYVDGNATVGRALWMAVHLVNTFLLVGALTIVCHYASGGAAYRLRGHGSLSWLAGASLLGMLLVGSSGAVSALGDTLFPPDRLGTALADGLSLTAHVLVRLRIVHPFLAVGVGLLLLFTPYALSSKRPLAGGTEWGLWLRMAVIIQLAAGMFNIMLLAPTWMQLVHLALADAVWITLVMLVVRTFDVSRTSEPTETYAPSGRAAAPGSSPST